MALFWGFPNLKGDIGIISGYVGDILGFVGFLQLASPKAAAEASWSDSAGFLNASVPKKNCEALRLIVHRQADTRHSRTFCTY